MMGKKQEDNFPIYSEKDIVAANKSLDQFISNCSAEVFRTFLPNISKKFEAVSYETRSSVSDSVAYFQIRRFVENQREQMIDCLKSVYNVLSNSGCGVALVIHRKLRELWRIGIRFLKVRVQPSVGQIVSVSHGVDCVFHAGSSLDDGVNIRGHITKTIIDQDRGSTNQNQFRWHAFADTPAILLGQLFQVQADIILCKFKSCVRQHF